MTQNTTRATERIVISHKICRGRPHITGTFIPVHLILDLLAAGKTAEEIVCEGYYPDLTVEDIHACIDFANRAMQY